MRSTIILLRCDFNDELYELTKAAQKTLEADQKILVDNASTKPLWNWADIVIPNKVNVGYPAAVNQGLEKATGDIIAIANNDIRVSPNWQSVSEEIFKEDPKIGSVHFRMVDYDEPMNLGYDTWITGKEKWCSSSFFVIKKEAKQTYDEGYKEGGYDDWDYWFRFREKGWKQAYTNRAAYQHKHSSTYQALDDGSNRFERDMRNKERFRTKFGAYPEELFAKQFPEQINKPWLPMP